MTSSTQTTPGGNRTSGAERGSEQASGRGKTSIADSVVQKVAGVATREVPGVYEVGGASGLSVRAIRERIPGSGGPSITRGVAVEIGEKEAAIDLQVVVDYGVSIPDLAQGIRRNVINKVERITGLDVVEVNVDVDDIHLPGEEESAEQPPPRVQ